MPSIDYFLQRTKALCDSLNLLQFKSTGIFTNAFNEGAPITRLLKDSAAEEHSLYKTGHRSSVFSGNNDPTSDDIEAAHMEVRPERKDGKSVFVDRSFNEYTQIKTTSTAKRTAVRVPEVDSYPSEPADGGSDPETSSQTERWIVSVCGNDPSVDRLCATVQDLVQKYPHLDEAGVLESVNAYSREYRQLSAEMDQYRLSIDEQRQRLQAYNSGQVEDIDEMIRREEAAIEQLEQQLMG